MTDKPATGARRGGRFPLQRPPPSSRDRGRPGTRGKAVTAIVVLLILVATVAIAAHLGR